MSELERRRRLKQVVQEAFSRSPEDREAYVAKA
jgi:hypothetical protein